MKVRAIAEGFHVGHRKRGEIFVISDELNQAGEPREFSKRWMEKVIEPLPPLPKVNPR